LQLEHDAKLYQQTELFLGGRDEFKTCFVLKVEERKTKKIEIGTF